MRTLQVREKLVFDTFIDSEPVERAYDGRDMAGLRNFNDSTEQESSGSAGDGIIET